MDAAGLTNHDAPDDPPIILRKRRRRPQLSPPPPPPPQWDDSGSMLARSPSVDIDTATRAVVDKLSRAERQEWINRILGMSAEPSRASTPAITYPSTMSRAVSTVPKARKTRPKAQRTLDCDECPMSDCDDLVPEKPSKVLSALLRRPRPRNDGSGAYLCAMNSYNTDICGRIKLEALHATAQARGWPRSLNYNKLINGILHRRSDIEVIVRTAVLGNFFTVLADYEESQRQEAARRRLETPDDPSDLDSDSKDGKTKKKKYVPWTLANLNKGASYTPGTSWDEAVAKFFKHG